MPPALCEGAIHAQYNESVTCQTANERWEKSKQVKWFYADLMGAVWASSMCCITALGLANTRSHCLHGNETG